jgi:N-acetylmuramoyl-L-alanine amidase
VSKFVVLIVCGWFALLCGCATPPTEPPPDWSATNQVSHVPAPPLVLPVPPLTNANPAALTTNIPTIVKNNAPPPTLVFTNPPPTTNVVKVPATPLYLWTSLKNWAAEQHVGPPRLLTKSPLVTYSIGSERGQMVLAIGTREATWNGVALHLGFAPEMIDGEIYLYGLDLEKSLKPFLCAPPLTFGTNRVIVIDPGHGGINAGTISVVDHRPEKEFTLDWARRLQPLLEQEGWQVFLTRTNDLDLALSNRVTVAENLHATLFMSLHFNSAAPDTKPAGVATFCLTPTGMPSSLTRGYPDIILQNFPNNNYDTQNVQLAGQLQRALVHGTGMEDRGVNRARFIGVLRGQRRPAVLVEAGFLSNPREARRIADPNFRQELAEIVASALK